MKFWKELHFLQEFTRLFNEPSLIYFYIHVVRRIEPMDNAHYKKLNIIIKKVPIFDQIYILLLRPMPEMAPFSAVMEAAYHLDASNCVFLISIYAIHSQKPPIKVNFT